MSAPLIPSTSATKADGPHSRDEIVQRERVTRAKTMEATLSDMVRRSASPASSNGGSSSSSGIGQMLIIDEGPHAHKTEAKKVAPADLHPKVAALKADISPSAKALLSLVVKADETYKGAQLIDLSPYAVKNALGLPENDAIAARNELERRGLIVFHDTGSGHRGYWPRLPAS